MASSVSADDSNSTERFLDAIHEPQDSLSPIKNYENAPLVSLEEVVVSIAHLVDNVGADVWVAKRNCKKPKDGLTSDESAAIYLYTMESVYRRLNHDLRNKKREVLVPWFAYLKLLLTALWKLPDVKCLLHRGVKADISDRYIEEETFVWWGITSCTSSISVLQSEQFLGQTGTRTLFSIESFNGKSIKNHSHFPGEKEVLLLPCSYFEVMGKINHGHGLATIHIRQLEPPVRLIQPPFNSVRAAPSRQHQSSHEHGSPTVDSVSTRLSQLSPFQNSLKTTTFDINVVTKRPVVRLNVERPKDIMCANDKYLLYFAADWTLFLVDEQGHQVWNSGDYGGRVSNICWSYYLQKFLSATTWCARQLHSIDLKSSKGPFVLVKEFDDMVKNAESYSSGGAITTTCHEKSFFINETLYTEGNDTWTESFHEYNMSDWKLIRTISTVPPALRKREPLIEVVRLNSDGSRLGFIMTKYDSRDSKWDKWFELRDTKSMSVLQTIELEKDRPYNLLPLPEGQFLLNMYDGNELFLIDANGKLQKKISYGQGNIRSTALINGECLVVQTDDELRFHNLQ
ncbi:unnamed protein product [Rotaria magnacalcarata]|nr:unnamed protein product [Rotaria magnacalcarata]